MRTQIFNAIKVSALAIVLSFGLSYVYAWTVPTATPPAGNVSAPINTSSVEQTKLGAFNIGSITAPKPLIVTGTIGATGDICTTVLGSPVCLSGSLGTNLKIAPSYTDLYNQNTAHSAEQTFSCTSGNIFVPSSGVKYVFVYMKGGNGNVSGSAGTSGGVGGAGGYGGYGGKAGTTYSDQGGVGGDGQSGSGSLAYFPAGAQTDKTGNSYDGSYRGGTAYGGGGGGVAIHTSLLNAYEPILSAGGGGGGWTGSSGGGGGYRAGNGCGYFCGGYGGGGSIGGSTIRINNGTGAPYNYTYAFNPADYGGGPFNVIAGCGGAGVDVYGNTTIYYGSNGFASVWW